MSMPTADQPTDRSLGRLSDLEREALKERAAELKTEAKRRGRGSGKSAAEEADVVAKIAAMPDPDRQLASLVHDIVRVEAPDLSPKLWYGQPAYAKDGKVICFFRSGAADKERYSAFGFTPNAALDDSKGLWPTAFAVAEITGAAEAMIREQVRRAAG